MGKHERGMAEATERMVVSRINNEEISDQNRTKGHEEIAKIVAHEIESDFSNIRECRHAGNSYDTIADIIVEGEKKHFLELKFVKSGNGTRANMGQDTLSKFGLFEDALSWSEFRERNNHEEWVREALNEFDYPEDKLKSSEGTKTRLYSKAKHLKNVINCGKSNTKDAVNKILESDDSSEDQKKAAKIIKKIIERDREEKIEYINHLKSKDQNSENVKRLSLLIIFGIHTEDLLKKHWDIPLDKLEEELKNYSIYYGLKKDSKVKKENPSSLLEELIEKEFFVDFKEDQTNVVIKAEGDEEDKVLLRAAFNWKNKFQGIQTPSLNIFKENGLKKVSEP